MERLNGWNLLVYETIINNFHNKVFSLKDIYVFESKYKKVYNFNFHIKDKIRQTLQNLRDYELLEFIPDKKGFYRAVNLKENRVNNNISDQLILHLISNPSIPSWVNIGITKSAEVKMAELNKYSLPQAFILNREIKLSNIKQVSIVNHCLKEIVSLLKIENDPLVPTNDYYNIDVDKANQVIDLISGIFNV